MQQLQSKNEILRIIQQHFDFQPYLNQKISNITLMEIENELNNYIRKLYMNAVILEDVKCIIRMDYITQTLMLDIEYKQEQYIPKIYPYILSDMNYKTHTWDSYNNHGNNGITKCLNCDMFIFKNDYITCCAEIIIESHLGNLTCEEAIIKDIIE